METERNGLMVGVGAGVTGALGAPAVGGEFKIGWALAPRLVLLLRADGQYATVDSGRMDDGRYHLTLENRVAYSVNLQQWLSSRWWVRAGLGWVRPNTGLPVRSAEHSSLGIPLALGIDVSNWRWGAIDLNLAVMGWRWREITVADVAFRFGFSIY